MGFRPTPGGPPGPPPLKAIDPASDRPVFRQIYDHLRVRSSAWADSPRVTSSNRRPSSSTTTDAGEGVARLRASAGCLEPGGGRAARVFRSDPHVSGCNPATGGPSVQSPICVARSLRPEICPGEQAWTMMNDTARQAATGHPGERRRTTAHAGHTRAAGHFDPYFQTTRTMASLSVAGPGRSPLATHVARLWPGGTPATAAPSRQAVRVAEHACRLLSSRLWHDGPPVVAVAGEHQHGAVARS
jgi:hypothetical protein